MGTEKGESLWSPLPSGVREEKAGCTVCVWLCQDRISINLQLQKLAEPRTVFTAHPCCDWNTKHLAVVIKPRLFFFIEGFGGTESSG